MNNFKEILKWESSVIKQTEYDYEKNELTIEFNNGKKYLYSEFIKDNYFKFIKAESKGNFFTKEINPMYKKNDIKVKII